MRKIAQRAPGAFSRPARRERQNIMPPLHVRLYGAHILKCTP